MTTDIDDITKEDFEAYEDVRRSGVTNMMFPAARELAGIDRDTHTAIMEHYRELCAKWPDVRTLRGDDD